MKTSNFEAIIDSLDKTAIYVVSESDHKILYYNDKLKNSINNIKVGDPCNYLLGALCDNCPLKAIGNNSEYRIFNYDKNYGGVVDIKASRIVWDDTIPAFLIAVTPHIDITVFSYQKMLRANLNTDRYEIIQLGDGEGQSIPTDNPSLHDWMENLLNLDIVDKDDVKRYKEFINFDRMKEEFKKGKKILVCNYRRKINGISHWSTMEIIKNFNYTDDNPEIILYVKDVSELYKEGLERESAKLKNEVILKTLGEENYAIYVVDLKTGSFEYIKTTDRNKEIIAKCEQNWDIILEELLKNNCAKDYHNDFRNSFRLDSLRKMIGKKNSKIELVTETNVNGIYRYVLTTAYIYENENLDPFSIIAFMDADERIKKEMMERDALKTAIDTANRANAEKSNFLSRMSHDIRTPLNVIIGSTTIANAHLDDKNKIVDCLSKINTSSKHLLALINEVLDLSKIESGKMDINSEPFSLADLFKDLLAINMPLINAKKQTLETRVISFTHENVIGDSIRLQQVFTNILSNAVKYTPEGGHIEIEVKELPSQTIGVGSFEFSFKDNGIGMSEEYQKHLFEPFTRADNTSTNKVEGSGLGMAIVNNIIHMMNGDIRVKSKLNEGSTFIINLLLKLQDDAKEDNVEFNDMHFLVVDDDELSCETISTMLNEIDCKSDYVLSGNDAIERLKNDKSYYGVIIDWKMPILDGVETAKRIRKLFGNDLVIIVISSYDWSNIEDEARKVGVDSFISKPLFKSHLIYTLRQFINKDDKDENLNLSNPKKWSFENKNILLVEDNELNLEIAKEILTMTKANVETAINGKEALLKFRNHQEGYYDVILMDVQMPIMNGYEATKEIRKLDRIDAKKIPIIAMTADAFISDINLSKDAGMNDHISKPLNIETLMNCLDKYFTKSS